MKDKEIQDDTADKQKAMELLLERSAKMNFDTDEKQRGEMKRKLLKQHQDYLRDQMDERNNKEVLDCKMHATDMVLNQRLIQNVDTPALADRSRRKPF